MKTLGYILLVNAFMVGCTSCHRSPEPINYGYNQPVNLDLYAYAYFKPGTYWVYQDSISGILDSVYITFANKGIYTNGDKEVAKGLYRGTFSWFTCEAISSYDHYKYKNWMDQSYEVNNNIPRVFRERYIMPGSGSKNGINIYFAIIDVGMTLFISLDRLEYKEYFNSFTIKAQSFSATQRWLNYDSDCDNDQNTNYYISKNIGIIRREQLDSNRTWNLIRYNIIQ
ncbi:MAG: hypothetical protein K0R26_1514 [Bacteroidota bacterium]|jgi:hypothetical protein|nr:hypothetical protein [Bacteroidota bacterium]